MFNPFQLYIVLKARCNGAIKLRKANLDEIRDELSYKSIRSVKNNLKILLDLNWIGHDRKSKTYYIRSFDRICKQCGLKITSCAEFNLKEINKFKAFIISSVIGALVAQQRRRNWKAEAKHGGASHPTFHKPPLYYVSNLALSKILNISISTAFDYKVLGENSGYLKIRKNFARIGVPSTYQKQYKKANPEVSHRVRLRLNNIVLQESDSVISNIRFKKRGKKSKHIGVV